MSTKKQVSVLSLIVGVAAAILAGWLLLSMFGIMNNFLGWDARQAGTGARVLTLIFLAVVVYQIHALLTVKIDPSRGSIAVVVLFLMLAVVASTGFKGTAGDIKQRVSYLNTLGKVVDTSVLFNCYDDFYKFSSDPDLKNYVRTYRELPGINTRNPFIRDGEAPMSQAPRANEYNFKWHTGSYEGKIPKDCGK